MTLSKDILKQLEDPKNRQIVNEGQSEFEVFFDEIEGLYFTYVYNSGNFVNISSELIKFMIIRHCIALMPCFDVPVNRVNLAESKVELVYGIEFVLQPTLRKLLLSADVLTIAELDKYAEENNLLINTQ